MRNFFEKNIFGFFTVGIVLLFLYSFTQIDLGLALTRFPALFSIQRAFQYVGYFNRPLSAWLYIGIVSFLFVCYFTLLSLARKKKLQMKTVWKFVVVVTALLAFSYNAFSYDLFNYIFDAKIFTYYHQNPYEHKALDYPQDPMLGFMHWTHRVYPYGPLWLAITIPLSYAGMHIFLLTFLLFKLLTAACFLGTVYFIGKIAQKTGSKNPLVPIIFFACNPLVLMESLVSGHNDIVMMFFALAGVYALLQSKYIISVLLIAVSVATKFATIFLLPTYFSLFVLHITKVKSAWSSVWFTAIGCMFLAVLAASQTSGNFQPWYLLYVFPVVALISENKFFAYVGGAISAAIAASYIPFLYLGNWDKPVPGILATLYISTTAIVLLSFVGYGFSKKRKSYL
jgi:Gpi18-like mannosyltransferase